MNIGGMKHLLLSMYNITLNRPNLETHISFPIEILYFLGNREFYEECDMRSKAIEPNCCCCGIRIGMLVLFVLSILFGISKFVIVFENFSLAFIVFSYIHASSMILCGMFGVYAVMKSSSKAIYVSIFLYVINQAISLSFCIFSLIVTRDEVDKQISHLQLTKTNSFTDEQLHGLRDTVSSSLYLVYSISLVCTVVLTPFVVERMMSYRKWLKYTRQTFE
eukprot:NODE_26_length_35450_cov_0.398320.p15 type:complete len:220 gc:universal NODE_26_length_35450_cov_0.398320:15149-14490(-)